MRGIHQRPADSLTMSEWCVILISRILWISIQKTNLAARRVCEIERQDVVCDTEMHTSSPHHIKRVRSLSLPSITFPPSSRPLPSQLHVPWAYDMTPVHCDPREDAPLIIYIIVSITGLIGAAGGPPNERMNYDLLWLSWYSQHSISMT